MTLDNNLIKVPSRVLPLESIYGKIESKKYDGGDISDWTRHVRSLPMFTCGNMGNWSFICCASLNEHLINDFIHSLRNVSTSMNFSMPPPQMLELLTYFIIIEHVKKIECLFMHIFLFLDI